MIHLQGKNRGTPDVCPANDVFILPTEMIAPRVDTGIEQEDRLVGIGIGNLYSI